MRVFEAGFVHPVTLTGKEGGSQFFRSSKELEMFETDRGLALRNTSNGRTRVVHWSNVAWHEPETPPTPPSAQTAKPKASARPAAKAQE